MMPYGMMGDYGIGYGFGILGLIFLIFVIIGLVLLIKYLWKSSKREQESALEVLKKRYARGEIDKEEFDDKKKDL